VSWTRSSNEISTKSTIRILPPRSTI